MDEYTDRQTRLSL